MSEISAIIKAEANLDALLSQTNQLAQVINSISRARTLAQTGAVEIDDLLPNPSRVECWVRSRYVPHINCLYEYFLSTVQGQINFASTIDFGFNASNALFTSDMFFLVQLGSIGDPTLLAQYEAGTLTAASSNAANTWKFAYCDLPGANFFDLVSFKINDVVIEQYSQQEWLDYLFHEVSTEKLPNLLNSLGQEPQRTATFYNPDEETTNQLNYTDGAQTLKFYQPPLTMYIPVLFPWLRDTRQPLNNYWLSENNRIVEATVADISKILMAQNIFTGATRAVDPSEISIQIQLYSRSVFLDDTFAPLFKVPRKVIVKSATTRLSTVTGPDQNMQLNSLGVPIEMFYLRFTPTANLDFSLGNQAFAFKNWYKPAVINVSSQYVVRLSTITSTAPLLVATPTTAYESADPVSGISLTVMDTPLFTTAPLPGMFYSDYLPMINGKILRSTQLGAYAIPFAQVYKGATDPATTGYLQPAVLDNLILGWTTTLITPANPAILSIGVRFVNYYEPSSGALSFQYQNVQ